jgi:hypothetical protein
VVNPSDDPLVALAQRLRALREDGLASHGITQRQLAIALSKRERASVPLISSWESLTNPKVPPQSRIEAYALFFATPRSVEATPYQLVELAELAADERSRHDEHVTGGSPGDLPESTLWHFPADQDITIVCGTLPEDVQQRMPYTNPDGPDFVKLYGISDPDALLEIHGHIRAMNPNSHVNVRT